MKVAATGLLMAVVLAAQAGDLPCRTALNIPCYTAQVTLTQWYLGDLWPGQPVRTSLSQVQAIRRDGSSMSAVRDGTTRDLLLLSNAFPKTSHMYLAPSKRIVAVDHSNRTYSQREPLIWHDLPYRRSEENDATCRSGIRHAGTDFRMTGTETIAGQRVVKWERSLGYGGYEEQYLAPAIDCMPLRTHLIRKNRFHLPVFVSTIEVTAIELGNPKPELFSIPVGYREVEDQERARMLDFLDRNPSARLSRPR